MTPVLNETLRGVAFYQAVKLLTDAGASEYLLESISSYMADELSEEAYEAAARLRGNWDDDGN